MTDSSKELSPVQDSPIDASPQSVLEGIFEAFSVELSAVGGFEEKAPQLVALLAREKIPNEAEVRTLIEAHL